MNNWNALISSTVSPSNAATFSLSEDSIQDLINQSEVEREQVRTALIEGILDKPKIKDKQHYVRVNQAILIRLLDKLHSYRHDPRINDKILYLYKTLSQHLEQTLDFIEDFFTNYFDRNEKVPAAYVLISIEELCKQLDLLRKTLQSSDAIDVKLASILINHFNRFCSQKASGATYNELMYQKELMNELLTNGTLQSEKSLKEVLFYFNFNDNDYVAYLNDGFKNLIQSIPNQKEKIAALRLEQKNINQLATRLNCYLSSGRPSLREQINHWIDEEVKFLDSHSIYNPSEMPFNKTLENVHVTFKAPEIYLLHKAFIDAGGAPSETYKSLLEKTSPKLSNKNQKGFSPESLKKASDKVDPESKENVKRFLQRMIRNIDSYN